MSTALSIWLFGILKPLELMHRFTTLFILTSFLLSCQTEPKESHFLECSTEINYKEISTLYEWDSQVIENDTAYIQVFFDTIKFDLENIINTITFTSFRDSLPDSFDWDNYIRDETQNIKSDFKLKNKGYYTRDNLSHYWFLVKDDTLTSYLEYITTNPLTIKDLVSSANINNLNDEFCLLDKISKQAKP